MKNGSGDKPRKINWVKIMGFRCQAKVLELDFIGKPLKILILTLSAEMTKSEQHVGEMELSQLYADWTEKLQTLRWTKRILPFFRLFRSLCGYKMELPPCKI